MKKARTRKNLFTIFSAILGVVFAFITGVTYCATSLNLIYGTKENSTSAFMGNQQYKIINDTIKNPIEFNQGAHNFEIALQYSFDYAFDLRVEYSLSWSNGESADNVILNFANRDNIIYDENYIYFANSFSAGSGRISIIAGVDFVDVNDEKYHGAKLTISLGDANSDGIRIYKAQESYSNIPSLVKGLLSFDNNNNVLGPTDNEGNAISPYNVAAHAWLQYKRNIKSSGTTNAYALMYNYRRDYEHGLQYPGSETAYKKPSSTISGSEGIVSGSVWTGGNRGYAGTGMYVIAGSSNLELEVQVAGIWRDGNSQEIELTFENNIQFNYAKDWEFAHYSLETSEKQTGLWDVRTFTYYIKANTGCYIDILDSVEITSAGIHSSIDYRIVTNSIVVNSTTFAYAEGDELSQFAQITSKETSKDDEFEYKQDNITVINTSKYSNGLYNSTVSGSMQERQQTFNTNLSLINNTNETKQLTIALGMNYHISNGQKKLYLQDDVNKVRAIDYIERNKTHTYENAFSAVTDASQINTLYYSCDVDANSYLTEINNASKTENYTLIIAPYASVNLLTSYSVSADLAGAVKDKFDTSIIDETTDSVDDYYDVWTYLVPQIAEAASSTAPNLVIETKQTENNTIISVKNNTNKTLTDITITDFALKYYSETNSAIIKQEPNDWDASYWKYYSVLTNKLLTTKPETFDSTNGYYTITKSYHNFVINTQEGSRNYSLLNGFNFGTKDSSVDTTKLFNTSKKLLPGESVEIISINATGVVYAVGKVETRTATTENDLTIINNGMEEAFIVNYSTKSYYLKLSGKHNGKNFKTYDGENFTYYIGIIRPGQIAELSMSSVGEISKIEIDYSTNNGEFVATQLTSWSDNAKNSMINYFDINKEN